MKRPAGAEAGGHSSGAATSTSVAQTKPDQHDEIVRPTIPEPNLEAVPAELRDEPVWLIWRYEHRDGKWTKVPHQADRRTKAASNDPETWTTLDEAAAALRPGWGLGFVFHEGSDVMGVDLDDARDPETGELSLEAHDIVTTLASYTEVSPSGEGIHVLIRASLAELRGRRRGNVEMYDSGRFFTFTGHQLEGTPAGIEPSQHGLEAVHARYIARQERQEAPRQRPQGVDTRHDDRDVLEAMWRSKNAAKIRALWEGDTSAHNHDHSAADLAFVDHLAFFTNGDQAQADRLFRQSGLMRDKWDERHFSDGRTYGEATLDRAFEGVRPGDGYQGRRHDKPQNHAREAGEAHHPARGSIPAPPDLALLDYPQDDLGYAHAIARQHHLEYRHHVSLGPLVYLPAEGRHVTGQAAVARAHELAILTQRSLTATAQQVDDKSERGRWESYAKTLRSRSKREAALELMLRTPAAARDDEIDGHALEINTPDGVLDLRTLELRPHDPHRIFTAVTRARFRPSAQHWTWDAILALLHEDDRAEYVQRVLGQAITGRNNREMFIFVGPKATGKTTLLGGLESGLGPDFGVTVDPSTLLEAGRTRSPGAPRADLVALRAARLALTSEPNRRARLDGETVKRMTGLDTITARGVHAREPISFRPAFTVVMLANEVPAADWQDDALLSRLKLVPFRARPPKVDPRVREALVDDPDQDALDALFTWAVMGAHAWIRDGYNMGTEPEAVTNATRTYRVEQNPFAMWAEDRLRFDQPDAATTVSDLHADYVDWAGRNGVTEPQRVEALGKWLKGQAEAGVDIERKRTKAGSSWRGVRIAGPTG